MRHIDTQDRVLYRRDRLNPIPRFPVMNAKRFLILSASLNVLLLALVFRSDTTLPAEVELKQRSIARETSPIAIARSTASSAEVITNIFVREITWEQVESPDYGEYISNLRAIGCPEETIRDIILADVNKLYDEKKKEVRGGLPRFEYWKAGNPMAAFMGDPQSLQQVRALEEEKAGVLRALGIEPDPMQQLIAAAGGNPMDIAFEFLPHAKRTEVMKVMTEFQARMMERSQDGLFDGQDMMKAQREMEQVIRQMLTPEEFLDYQLRFSVTANLMRSQLAGFEPSEEEFLTIFHLRDAFDQEHSPFVDETGTEEQLRQRQQAHATLDQQIRDTLGSDRFAEYQRAQDPQYQQLRRIAQRAELPEAVANDVYHMRGAAETQADSVRQDATLSGDQRNAALLAIRRETEQTMRQTLGDDAWQQYNRPNNVWWLRNIAPEERGQSGR